MQKNLIKTRKMKIKNIIAGLTILLMGLPAFSQSLTPFLIGAGGGTGHENGKSLHWAIGEVAVATLQSDDAWLTQGFLQGSIQVTSSFEAPGLAFSINAYPNPASQFVTLQLDQEFAGGLHYQLYDISGRLMLQGRTDAAQTRISLSELKPSVYFLKVLRNESEVKTFRIIKQ